VLASDCELPFLPPATPAATPDFLLRLTSRIPAPAGTLWHQAPSTIIDATAEGDLIVRFEDDTRFLIGRTGRELSLIDAPPAYTRDDLAAYVLGPILTIALHLQGAVLLHASSAVLGDKAVLFAGSSGSGKSTTAAMLHRLGYTILSDDMTEIDGTRALPAIPTLRLWPEALEALYGSAAAFPDRAPSWDKKIVTIDAAAAVAHEIAAILFLEHSAEEPQLRRLDPRSGWMRLIADAPAARLPGAEARIFEATSALADRVPMFAFLPPPLEDSSALGAFLERELAEWLR
jgi:hypothetical protein